MFKKLTCANKFKIIFIVKTSPSSCISDWYEGCLALGLANKFKIIFIVKTSPSSYISDWYEGCLALGLVFRKISLPVLIFLCLVCRYRRQSHLELAFPKLYLP